VVAGLFCAAAACSSSTDSTTSTTAEDAVVTADVAALAADGAAEDVDVMSGMDGSIGNIASSINADNSGVAYFSGPGGFRPGLTGCTFAGGVFTCPAALKNGLSVSRTVSFLDASGATESGYDSLLTASIHITADISGDRTHGAWTATVSRHRDFTISGLAGTETSRTIDGTGNENVSNSRVAKNDSVRTYTVVGSSVVASVVLPVRSSDGGNGWPASGTITRTFTITVTSGPNSGKTETRTVVITFNGTSTPTGTVNGVPFTIDLTARTATPKS
jgi:hypothetical protein